MSDLRTAQTDIVILGGGVAALWCANVLKNAGHSIAVLTNGPLGGGQSLAAQGVIHGGLKYAVGGKLTESSEALAEMPSRWLAALDGRGPVNLRDAQLLSDHQIMWSLPGVISKTVGFFGSKALRGRSQSMRRDDYPEIFNTPAYKGALFRIDEPVIDPPSIIRELARGVANETWQIEWGKNAFLDLTENAENASSDRLAGIRITNGDGQATRLTAQHFLLAAGAGNRELLSRLGIAEPAMQTRPLHQLIIRKSGLPDFYSVCVGSSPKPPLVVTTHTDSQGRTVWYVGGDIAEQAGVDRSAEEQIDAGKALFSRHLPWVDLSDAEWFTHRVDRAEPHTETGDRPPGAYLKRLGNILVTWPTKLALAPNLGDQVLSAVNAPSSSHPPISLKLTRPDRGKAPWDLS